MNDYTWVREMSAPVAIAVGAIGCFLGYRLLRLSLAVMGLIAGAAGGWEVGFPPAHGSTGIALVCAVAGAVVGAVLCIWLYLLGVFALGASAGAIVAGALFNGTGHPAQPLFIVGLALIFGLIALVLQKFMIIASTAFSGSYLITAAIWHMITRGNDTFPMWFNSAHAGSPGLLDYAAVAIWLLLGVAGARFQYGNNPRKAEGENKRK